MLALVVTTHPIQYQAPLFRKLGSMLDLTVLFMMRQTAEGQARSGFGVEFDWDVPLLHGYEHLLAHNAARHPSTDKFNGIVLAQHARLLNSLNPTVVMLMGWFPRGYLQVARWARTRSIPLVCRGESNLVSGRSLFKRIAKALYFRWLFRKFETFAVIGRRNHDFYRHYGVAESKLIWAPYSIDTDFFEGQYAVHRRHPRKPGPWRLGFAGKLIPKKRPMDLVEAVAHCGNTRQVRLVFIGDGPLRPELERRTRCLGLTTEFCGFLNQTEIVAKGYADLDALVLPSGEYETWGLVVNEAMTGGIPVVASDKVGCTPDLIEEARTGYVFPSGDVGGLSKVIANLLERLNADHDFSSAVRERVRLYSLYHTAEGIRQALVKATAHARAHQR